MAILYRAIFLHTNSVIQISTTYDSEKVTNVKTKQVQISKVSRDTLNTKEKLKSKNKNRSINN